MEEPWLLGDETLFKGVAVEYSLWTAPRGPARSTGTEGDDCRSWSPSALRCILLMDVNKMSGCGREHEPYPPWEATAPPGAATTAGALGCGAAGGPGGSGKTARAQPDAGAAGSA